MWSPVRFFLGSQAVGYRGSQWWDVPCPMRSSVLPILDHPHGSSPCHPAVRDPTWWSSSRSGGETSGCCFQFGRKNKAKSSPRVPLLLVFWGFLQEQWLWYRQVLSNNSNWLVKSEFKVWVYLRQLSQPIMEECDIPAASGEGWMPFRGSGSVSYLA